MSKSHRAKRKSKGMCRDCTQPTNGTSQLCSEHRRQDTVQNRNRRRAKSPCKVICGMCEAMGHRYDTCPLNPESKQ